MGQFRETFLKGLGKVIYKSAHVATFILCLIGGAGNLFADGHIFFGIVCLLFCILTAPSVIKHLNDLASD